MTLSFLMFRLMRPMFKLIVVGILALATMPAHAEFTGGGAIYAPNNCTWPTRVEMTRARYVASETTGGDSVVTLNFAAGGLNTYSFRSNLSPRRAWRRGALRTVWGELYFAESAPLVRVIQRSDAVYSGDADLENNGGIRLRLRIRNFNGEQGCTVSVALMLNSWD